MRYLCFRGKDDIQGPSAGLVLGLTRPEVERPLSFRLGPWAPWTVCAEMPEWSWMLQGKLLQDPSYKERGRENTVLGEYSWFLKQF